MQKFAVETTLKILVEILLQEFRIENAVGIKNLFSYFLNYGGFSNIKVGLINQWSGSEPLCLEIQKILLKIGWFSFLNSFFSWISAP